jgi:hypothetical protein
MSVKKSSTPRKSAAIQQRTPSLETQAKAILKSPNIYDADTRNMVGVALANLQFSRSGGGGYATSQEDVRRIKAGESQDEAELRELIRKAKTGEPVFDVTGIGEGYVSAARTIYEVITKPNDIPQFVYDAVTVVLDEAQKQAGGKLFMLPNGCEDSLENYDYSISNLLTGGLWPPMLFAL